MNSALMQSGSAVQADIVLQGVRVNNLRDVDVRIRRNALTVICGVSGSGKSSLAFDTLFAEGQRRYVETFSPGARQFLDQLERPQADRIDGIPPAIAIRQNARTQSARSTIGTRTEILSHLRTLFARLGQAVCPDCDQAAVSLTPESAAEFLTSTFCGRRGMIVISAGTDNTLEDWLTLGFVRCIANGKVHPLEQALNENLTDVLIVTDRVRITEDAQSRIAESLEQAWEAGRGRCSLLVEHNPADGTHNSAEVVNVDGKDWIMQPVSSGLTCLSCGTEFSTVSADQLNFLSPLGACQTCEGFGQVSGLSFNRIVPDDRVSLQDGAIQPWTTPAYRHELDELLDLADDYGIPTDVPFRDLTKVHRQLIYDGVPEREFGGVTGFHRWLVRHRYKQGVSVLLSRWRSWLTCPDCQGSRLANSGGTIRLNDIDFMTACQMELAELSDWLRDTVAGLPDQMAAALNSSIRQLTSRVSFLVDSGLGYLSLDRTLKSLSGGEAQRVALTAALGSGLINTLYVLDEPTSGLHQSDTQRIIAATRQLQQLGNTVVVVEHDPDFIRAADEVIEIGPGAGNAGGQVVFQGNVEQLLSTASTATGTAITVHGRDERSAHTPREPQTWLQFRHVTCHNIHELTGRIPLETVCVVTGVSGSGKSSLMVDTLYPELCRHLGRPCPHDAAGCVESVTGLDHIDDVVLLDQNPLPRSRRSIPATVVGGFDEIRKALAGTHEAKKRSYSAGMFSFNSSKGGRCPNCDGNGIVTIEMQFLADIQTICEECAGRRFRPDVLEVRYRDRSVDDILNMTAEDAFSFFNGNRKIQQKLNALRQAGLGYIRLGQPVATLSGGESQRLRIAALLAGVPLDDGVPGRRSTATSSKTARTLFILDEPSTGLHLKDVSSLMQCLNHLVDIGHSVVVIEHDESIVRAADYVIEMGPGPGRQGGRIISSGPPILND